MSVILQDRKQSDVASVYTKRHMGAFLTSVLDGGERSASHLGYFTSGKSIGSSWIRGWVWLQRPSGRLGREKSLALATNRATIPQPSSPWSSDCTVPAPRKNAWTQLIYKDAELPY